MTHNIFLVRDHWIYHLIGSGEEILYIGCTCDPKRRIKAHKSSKLWWPEVERVKWFALGPIKATYAMDEEKRHIERHVPTYNLEHRMTRAKREGKRIVYGRILD